MAKKKLIDIIGDVVENMQDNKSKVQNETTENEQAKAETGNKGGILGGLIEDIVDAVKGGNKTDAQAKTGKKSVLSDLIEDVVDAVKGGNKTDAQANTGKKNVLGDLIENVVDAVKKGGKSEPQPTPREVTPVPPVQKTAKVRVNPVNKK